MLTDPRFVDPAVYGAVDRYTVARASGCAETAFGHRLLSPSRAANVAPDVEDPHFAYDYALAYASQHT